MLAQTEDQKANINALIPELMATKVKKIIEVNLARYGDVIAEKLGMDEDAIMNDMREQIWKGIITHRKAGGANLNTWLNTLITNRFRLLIKRAHTPKYKNMQYYENVFEKVDENSEAVITEVTSETLYERREKFVKETARLPSPYKEIYESIAQGCNMRELMNAHNMSRPSIVAALSKIEVYLSGFRSTT